MVQIGGGKFRHAHGVAIFALCIVAVSAAAPNAYLKSDYLAPNPAPSASAAPRATPLTTPSPSPTPGVVKGASTVATAAPAPVHTGVGGSAFGIAGNLASLSPAQLGQRLDDLKTLGVGWVRYDVEWSNIEYQGPGQYDWGTYDRVVQAVSAHGLRSLAIIDYTPAWARRSDCADTAMCAPADPATYAAFAGIVASRYAAYGVHDYEIWNEPNNADYFKPAANPVLYTAMLKAAYAAIKSADRQSFILTGGTAPAASANGYLSPVDFVNALYANGAQGSFDALAHHPYTYPYSSAYPNPYNAWGQLTTLHGIMAAHGDGAKKIWVTEYGAPTGGPGGLASNGMTTAEGGDDHVTEALQSQMVIAAVNGSFAYPWMGPLFWYTYQDAGTATNSVENFFGLVRADGSKKPAYYTFQNAMHGY